MAFICALDTRKSVTRVYSLVLNQPTVPKESAPREGRQGFRTAVRVRGKVPRGQAQADQVVLFVHLAQLGERGSFAVAT